LVLGPEVIFWRGRGAFGGWPGFVFGGAIDFLAGPSFVFGGAEFRFRRGWTSFSGESDVFLAVPSFFFGVTSRRGGIT